MDYSERSGFISVGSAMGKLQDFVEGNGVPWLTNTVVMPRKGINVHSLRSMSYNRQPRVHVRTYATYADIRIGQETA